MIDLHAHDLTWPARAEALAREVERLAGWPTGTVEHVGSTAVAGLDAKPILDLMGAVADIEEARATMSRLVVAGWEYLPEFEAQLPFRLFARLFEPDGRRVANLHVYAASHVEVERHRRFRGLLRRDAGARQRYARAKHDLAAATDDIDVYAAAKDELIDALLATDGAPPRAPRGPRAGA